VVPDVFPGVDAHGISALAAPPAGQSIIGVESVEPDDGRLPCAGVTNVRLAVLRHPAYVGTSPTDEWARRGGPWAPSSVNSFRQR